MLLFNGGAMAPSNKQQEVANMVTFMSYNSTGMNSVKTQFVNEICDENEINYLTIQEHFKSNKTTDKFFRDNYRKYHSYVIPGHRAPGQDSGRAKAGLAQLSKKCIAVRKDRVVTRNFRIQAQVLNFSSRKILWLNTYLPTDPQTKEKFDDTELSGVLMEVETILTSVAFTDVVWAGDMNWDIDRNTAFSRVMKEFVARMGLVSIWQEQPVDFTHVHTDNKSVSTLDHFLISPCLLPDVSGCGVIHRGDNMSRHSPIWLKINLGSPIPVRELLASKSPRKPSWLKATQTDAETYAAALQVRLKALLVPESMHCTDCKCSNPTHSQERDSFTLDILIAIVETTHTTLPFCGGRRVSNTGGGIRAVPGWQEEVEPFQQETKYWHRVWLREGRPSQGWLYLTMIKKRAQYHYAVRRQKKKADQIRAEKLFQASMQGDMDLLQEMKVIRGGGGSKAELPDTVAGANGEEEIVEKFKEVYSTLYNSAGSQAEMGDLKCIVEQLIHSGSLAEVDKVSGNKVKEAVGKMKARKGDVSGGFTSDALLNAPDILFDQLAVVFRSWLVHGTVSLSLLACAFLPLLKSSLKNPADPGSYRAIAGSSLLLKLFEKVILLVWGHLLASDSLQFGYKSGTSTTQCSWLVQEVVGHFLRNGSNPILTVLDCSKAFDTCMFGTMFTKLLDTGLPPIVIRTMMVVYEQQYAWVKWGQAVSTRFNITNGTRQGSVASPVLWCVYLDMLIKELRELGLGCHVGGLFMGAVVYADDVLLMAPSRPAMQAMLRKCEDYAAKNNIMFSTDPDPGKSKTKCILVCGNNKNLAKPASLTLCGRDLPWVSSANHLGHELHESGTMELDASIKRATFISKSVEIRELFKFASPVEVLQTMKVNCCSFYGCMLWDLSGSGAGQVYNAWSTAVKLSWSVPRATRSYLVQHVLSSGLTSVKVDILARYGNFFRTLRKSPCHEVAVMANLAGRDYRTTTGSNLKLLEESSGLNPWEYSSSRLKEELVKREKVDIPDQDKWRVGYLATLLERRQVAHYQGLEEEEKNLDELLDSLCVN